jgi:signal transduction histidine kinase
VRSRLLVVTLFLMGLLAAGLGIPLAVATAQREQLAVFADRLSDTVYFASIAERPLTEDDAGALTRFAAELARHDEVYGIAVLLVGRDGRTLAASRPDPPSLDEQGTERVRLALAARGSQPYPLILPWDDSAMVLAEPVLVDGEARGAVVTVSPTAGLRTAELRVWSLLAAAVALALGVGALVALPVTRWILRPVERLDEGMGRVAAAVLAGGTAEPVSDGTGPPELRRLSASFDRMAGTVTQALAAQRAFVADASHQLRNPLTALRLRLSNLEGHVDEVAVEDQIAALEEAERLSTLLDGLLALARAERTVTVQRVDVDAGVEDRLDAWRPLAEHSGLRLVRSGARGLTAGAAAGGIEALLDAVLDNAVKFSPPGATITVCTAAVDGLVEITVRDTGPGLPPEELERATDRFWRSPGQHNVEGSGLGLAIAARTAELAGGDLRLELPDGGGLLVRARLPRVPDPTGGAQPPVM